MPKISLFPILCILIFVFGCRPTDKMVETEILSSPTQKHLYEVVFCTPDTGFAFGGVRFGMGLALRTTDAGKTWRADSLCFGGLYDASVRNRKNITITGQNGQLISSQNAGTTWDFSPHYQWRFMQSIAHFSDTRMVSVGGESYGSGVRVTYENGQRIVGDTIDHELHAVAVANATTAVAVGYGYVCRTTDGAQMWQRLDVRGDNFQDIQFVTPTVGYIVGLSGAFLRTDDAGATWKMLRNGNDIFADGSLRSVFFTDTENGFVCGNNGLLWRTTDGGKTWLEIPNLPKNNLNSLYFSRNTGYAVGDDGLIVKLEIRN